MSYVFVRSHYVLFNVNIIIIIDRVLFYFYLNYRTDPTVPRRARQQAP